jgi:NADH-quinone oxidoreductase subunit A
MPVNTASSVFYMAGAILAAVGFVGLVFGANKLLSPRNPTSEKAQPFECGMEQQGDPHRAVTPRYAAIAVLFVLFDAEAVLLFAVAPRLHGSPGAFAAIAAFSVFLAFGLVYAWRKGALTWRW